MEQPISIFFTPYIPNRIKQYRVKGTLVDEQIKYLKDVQRQSGFVSDMIQMSMYVQELDLFVDPTLVDTLVNELLNDSVEYQGLPNDSLECYESLNSPIQFGDNADELFEDLDSFLSSVMN